MSKLILVLGLFPALSFGADYSHCIDFVNKSHSAELSLNGIFKLNDQGKIDTSGMHRDAIFAQNGDIYVFRQKSWLSNDTSLVTTVKTVDGRPLEISAQYVRSNAPQGDPTVLKLTAKNGVCYPEVLTGTINSNFNVNLCRELADYLSANPEAKKCGQCGNDRTNKGILDIMGKYEDVTKRSKINTESPKADDPIWGQVIKMTNQPLSRALNTLDSCDKTPGLGSALADGRVWAKPSSGSQRSQPRGSTQPAN